MLATVVSTYGRHLKRLLVDPKEEGLCTRGGSSSQKQNASTTCTPVARKKNAWALRVRAALLSVNLEQYDHLLVTRPDAVLVAPDFHVSPDPRHSVSSFPRQFAPNVRLPSLCDTQQNNVHIVSGAWERQGCLHNRDWDFMLWFCEPYLALLWFLIYTPRAGLCNCGLAWPASSSEQLPMPPMPPGINGSLGGNGCDCDCTAVALMTHAHARLGTLDKVARCAIYK